jgi:MoxR-like ATPase
MLENQDKYNVEKTVELKRPDKGLLSIKPYFLGESLRKAVDMAIALRRPLLLKGDPGCGKTRLAEAVAYALYGADFDHHYFEWNIKSSSKVSDGIYTFDHIRRLRDAQLDQINRTTKSDDLSAYIAKGALAKAFEASKKGKPSVLLIDEIDKADIDFPNDLLLELDQKRFEIPELKQNIIAEEAPIIFITSNDEKDLPPAFLRRCLFHYVDFPSEADLLKIVKANFADFDDQILNKAIEKFEILRGRMQGNNNAEKRVSTSELIDWIFLIQHFKLPISAFEGDEYPMYQALLKSRNDEITFKKK